MLYRLSALFEEDIMDHVMLDIVSESDIVDDIIDEFGEADVFQKKISLFENTDDIPKMTKNIDDINTDDQTEDLMKDLDIDDIMDYVESEG